MPDASDDAWKAAWQPMIEAVGREFDDEGAVRWGADAVDAGNIRRFLEPLEFDCPLHYDDAVAREHGYEGIIAPYTSAVTYTIGPLWSPGDAIFQSDDRDAIPVTTALRQTPTGLEPPTTGYFATDVEIEWFRPVRPGDRLGRRGRRLLSCVPKETSVGRGAFMTWESDIVDADLAIVAKIRSGTYNYEPKPVVA
jgi:hypothetical protein